MVDELRNLDTERYRPSAFNVGFNDGAAAGQTVGDAAVDGRTEEKR